MRTRLKALLAPEGLLLVAAILVSRWDRFPPAWGQFVAFAPSAVGLAGLILAWRLRRSRLVFALVTLALAYLLVTRWKPQDPLAFQLAAVLLPITLATIALLPERGVLTVAGIWQWVATAVLAGLVYAVFRTGDANPVPAALRHDFLPERFFAWTPLPQPALLAFLLSFGLVAAARRFAPGSTGNGYLWALAAAFLAFQTRDLSVDRTLYFATAGGVLVVAAIELSYVLAYHDALTGLPGRRALDEALARLGGPYTVAMVDVDHFKRFNDTYGHDVGDQVLRTVASRVAEALPDAEVFRYGGEEFAALFAGRSVEECLPLLEGAREAVGGDKFTVRGRLRPKKKPAQPRRGRRRQQETITVSIGAAERDAKHSTAAEVVQAADKALYRAKEGGRNQVQR